MCQGNPPPGSVDVRFPLFNPRNPPAKPSQTTNLLPRQPSLADVVARRTDAGRRDLAAAQRTGSQSRLLLFRMAHLFPSMPTHLRLALSIDVDWQLVAKLVATTNEAIDLGPCECQLLSRFGLSSSSSCTNWRDAFRDLYHNFDHQYTNLCPIMANQADRIAQALQSLENHQFRSRRQAAIHFRVPLSTLCHRANGRGEIDLSSQHLTNAQEEVVLQWIKDLQRQFMPPTYDQVRYIVARLHNFRPLGKHWITRFKARHPELETSRARVIEIQRLQGADPNANSGLLLGGGVP